MGVILWARPGGRLGKAEREFCIDNLLVRIHFIIVMVGWTGLAPWEFEFPFPDSLTSTFLVGQAPPYTAAVLKVTTISPRGGPD